MEENIDEAKDLINEIKEMLPESKIKDAVIEIEKQIKFAGELLATFNMVTGGANLGTKPSQVESRGPSALSRLPTRDLLLKGKDTYSFCSTKRHRSR